MQIKVKKMDKRYVGSECFMYCATITLNHSTSLSDRADLARQMREWCWDNYGPSCDYMEYRMLHHDKKPVNPRWAWMYTATTMNFRIMLNDEIDRNWFILRWSNGL
jgi:hypothetical protein